jgi:Ca2+-binding EF-hand superfamily protein
MRLENSKLTRDVLGGFDTDGDENLNFKEFVGNMWYFVVKDLQSVAEYTFDAYDIDGSGELTKTEITAMLEEVYGSEAIQTTVRLFIQDMDGRDQNKKISKREFSAHCTDYPQLIYPAMEVQTALKRHIGGDKFWNRLIDESKK